MLRMKRKNISMQLIIFVVLCVCCCLVTPIWLTSTRAAQPPQQPYYVVDAYQTPGVVYKIVNRKPRVFFRRRSGTITSIALCRGQLYFCSVNDKRIYQSIGKGERVVFDHTTYVRDIAVDSYGNLYFSEASSSRGNGKIYKLTPRTDKLGPKDRFNLLEKEKPISVYLKNVDGFWAGDFTFDARDNLYLSTGDRTPSFIYKVPKEGGRYCSPKSVYKETKGAIKGIAMEPINPNLAYYADWGHAIYKLDVRNLRRSVEFSGNIAKSKNPHLSDIAFDVRIRSKK